MYDVGMPVVFVIICIPPLFEYILAVPSLFPSALLRTVKAGFYNFCLIAIKDNYMIVNLIV